MISIELVCTMFSRLQEDDDETPCFPTRNDRMAFINETLVLERSVSFTRTFSSSYFIAF
jgi:hypothetical protein